MAPCGNSAGQYVNGAVHTQTIDGFWSLLKRGIMGSFHKVSRKYLPLYVAEFEWRYNNRNNADIFGAAIAHCCNAKRAVGGGCGIRETYKNKINHDVLSTIGIPPLTSIEIRNSIEFAVADVTS
jgi:ISXO2-like transposase domain